MQSKKVKGCLPRLTEKNKREEYGWRKPWKMIKATLSQKTVISARKCLALSILSKLDFCY